MTQVGEGVVFGLRRDLVSHLLGQSTTFFSSTRGGDVLSRVLNDVAGVNASLSSHLTTGVRSELSIASMLVLMLVLDWRLRLLALLVLPVVVLAGAARGAASATPTPEACASTATTCASSPSRP